MTKPKHYLTICDCGVVICRDCNKTVGKLNLGVGWHAGRSGIIKLKFVKDSCTNNEV